MNILVMEDAPFIELEYLEYIKDAGHSIFKLDDDYDKESIDAIIINIKKVDEGVVSQFPNLKYIFRTGVGLDMIDHDICRMRDIKVRNTPWANADSVADISVWWIIGLLRNTYLKFDSLLDSFNFKWKEVSQNTVAIFWFGAIGKWIYNRLLWFWVKEFLIYDPFLSKEHIEEYKYCKKVEDKNELLKNSDVICLNLPLVKETFHFIWKSEFELLKKDVIISNVSRWHIIDEKYLAKFLSENKHAWAYLDVWEDEPEAPNRNLLELENCVITPHIWAMTTEAYKRMHRFEM